MSDIRARARPASTPVPAPAPAPSTIPTNPRLSKKPSKTTKTTTPLVTPTATFALLLLARLLSARYATIPDCDEVFNFWEPAHYLSHSHGLQTWEYSPLYAIRSWAYVLLHSALSRPVSLLPGLSKIHEFYALRAVFAVACAYAETRLYRAVARNVDRRVGALYLVFAAGSAGMFHAAVAFLPSTFAMYTGMLAAAAFLEGGLVEGIVWTAVGGFLGWPFCLVMCVPWLLGALVAGAVDGRVLAVVVRCVKGGLWSAGLLAIIVAIDSAFYRKLETVPLNIVLYNVFSDPSRGPNIYGTEPWYFYILNLTLNHNILLPLSLAALPTLALSALLKTPTTRREITMTLPYYLWLAIFTLQPHKEERFMFLAYPMLLVNAAIALNHALHIVGKVLPSRAVTRVLATTAVILTALLSLSRTLAVTTSYSAPLNIYAHLPPDATGNLCLGAEWYRFPSHYFVPAGVRAKWIPAGFHGLLPGEFPEEGGTWKVPLGMNDMNIEDEGKYVQRGQCDYVVGLEQERLQEVGWVLMARERFLEKDATGFLGRVFWAPAWLVGERRVWSWYELWARV